MVALAHVPTCTSPVSFTRIQVHNLHKHTSITCTPSYLEQINYIINFIMKDKKLTDKCNIDTIFFSALVNLITSMIGQIKLSNIETNIYSWWTQQEVCK